MTVAEMFESFIQNLAIDDREQISNRYGEITSTLNKKYRDSSSKTANSLQVGSYGRYTAIKGVSDLDMVYIMPSSEWERFKNGRQSALLQEVKSAILERYPNTDIRGDGQVVVVSFSNYVIEVLPAFEQDDDSFKYPNTKDGGSWEITKPREEISATSAMDKEKNSNLRCLCKMARAWKNKHGVVMGGLLIDTLAYNFLNSTSDYDSKSYMLYDEMSRDFFKYLYEQPEQDYYLALGSRQRVKVKKKFQRKAKKAYNLCKRAIEAESETGVNDKWKAVFGRPFPSAITTSESTANKSAYTWRNTEEFIEDKYPVDIRYSLEIDCNVTQAGFRSSRLINMLRNKIPLFAKKKLLFHITQHDVPAPYQIFWKVLNRGDEAKLRDEIRGQIMSDDGSMKRNENTKFRGRHLVECYAFKEGIIVARGSIDVPITSNADD